ncbi:helix-turn-helix transcriptional regulator [Luteimicrobium album]
MKTIYRWRTRGYGPRAILVGKHLRWRQDDIDSWIDGVRESA